MKNPFINKKAFKRRAGKCQICGEKEYALLDTHRWRTEGKDGGKYSTDNCLCVCSNCHRLITSDIMKIIGIFDSSIGKVVNYIDKNGKEHFNLL